MKFKLKRGGQPVIDVLIRSELLYSLQSFRSPCSLRHFLREKIRRSIKDELV